MTLRSIHREAIVVISGLTLLATISWTTEDKVDITLSRGDILPKVKITNERSTRDVLTNSHAEGLSLVHFWAAYDAESRAKNVAYTKHLLGKEGQISYQAISLDLDADVYQQTLAFDGLGGDKQMLTNAAQRTELMRMCQLNEGFKTFLVNERGEILLVNPTTEELDKFVRN